IGFFHDDELFTVDLHFGAGPLAEQDVVADLEIDRNELAGFVAAALADSDHFAFGRLFLRGIRNDDARLRALVSLDAADDDTVMQRTEFHKQSSKTLIY